MKFPGNFPCFFPEVSPPLRCPGRPGGPFGSGRDREPGTGNRAPGTGNRLGSGAGQSTVGLGD
eukprot:scaffold17803_cov115-Isochrysis_galbana.AAC.1